MSVSPSLFQSTHFNYKFSGCFCRFAARQFTVRLGDVDLKRDDEPSAPVTYGVQEIIAHSEFSRVGFYNDLAILVLDKPVKKSKYVIPLCLPDEDLQEEKFAGQTGTVVGWGTTYYGSFFYYLICIID